MRKGGRWRGQGRRCGGLWRWRRRGALGGGGPVGGFEGVVWIKKGGKRKWSGFVV